jgi:hypothetical protein
MNKKSANWLFAIITPPLLGLKYVLWPINELVFRPLDFWLAKRDQKQFEREIELKIPFLFSEYGARFLPEKIDPRAVSATIDVGTFLLSFTRWHRELTGFIKAKNAERGISLSELTDAFNIPFYLRGKVDYSLEDWDVLLKLNMPQLQEVFSSGQYGETKEYLRELKRTMGC